MTDRKPIPRATRCETCRHYHSGHLPLTGSGLKTLLQVEEHNQAPAGECRANPPVSVDAETSRWPAVWTDDFCSRWEPLQAQDKLTRCALRLVKLIELGAPAAILHTEVRMIAALLPPTPDKK